jgi:hypothetical protein
VNFNRLQALPHARDALAHGLPNVALCKTHPFIVTHGLAFRGIRFLADFAASRLFYG